MALIYVLDNFINDNSDIAVSSEHELYVRTNIYNRIPSKPWRSIGVGSPGPPVDSEWLCIDLGFYSGVNYDVTYVGLFNHNLTQLQVAGDILTLEGCDDGCQSDAWVWHSGCCYTDLTTMDCEGTKPIANFKNTCHKVDCPTGFRYWMLEVIDQANTDRYLEIGELVFGQWQEFHRGSVTGHDNWVHLQPGRPDGPAFFMGNQRTYFGQDWTNYYSDAEYFTLVFKNISDPCVVDEIQVFLQYVQRNGGKFVIVPDDTKPFCYYVVIENLDKYANRLIYGCDRELREWRIELKTLTQGVRLL